ncbi:MAG: ATP-dependent DNA ligase [Actinobacteria bacterium]|nr:ATP-dependent DNA ligase [Actinomycetota bacterium]
MLLSDVVTTSRAVGGTRSRSRKVALLAERIAAIDPSEAAVGVRYLAGEPRQNRLELGPAALRDVRPPAAREATLTLSDVDGALEEIAAASGQGSRSARLERFGELLAAATEEEQSFLRSLVVGDLRQGALEGVVVQALAEATDADLDEVRRAVMLRGDLSAVAAALVEDGPSALASIGLELLRPVQPMLATNAGDLDGAMTGLDRALAEYKLDGARVQIHRASSDIRVFTRNLNDVTERLPEVVRVIEDLDLNEAVLDGEVIALRDGGRPHPFQVTMSRFGTEAPEGPAVALRVFVFDVLHLDGADLLGAPLSRRVAALDGAIPEGLRIPNREVRDRPGAGALLEEALRAGHEGIMVKDLDAPYEAGRRGAAWRKVKPVHTLDLVVLAAEWGHGRRQGWLSNIHLGARDRDGGFVMLGKTFKGMTDEMLEWQTARFLELERDRRGRVVHLQPELVVEVAFDGVQTSPRYPAGMALRFARVKGYRPDKDVTEADTLDSVRAIHAGERLPIW